MKKIKLFWLLVFVGIIFLTSACASPTKTEDINLDFSCGDPVEFTYREETVVYGSVSGQNDTCWLDRNLGASQVCTSLDDEKCYGDLFQWGRGDDGHQDRTSSETSTLSSTDIPGSNFITTSVSPYDWRDPQNDDLWQGVDGINNPCLPGWRIPTESELTAEMNSWSTPTSSGAYASVLKWPSAGLRYDDGSFENVGTYGYIWSSSVSSLESIFLAFGSSEVGVGSGYRADGFSVRCLRD